MRRILIRPARPGLLVRAPRTLVPLPEDWSEVDESPYWLRRRSDGDIEIDEPVEHAVEPQADAEGE